MNIYTVKYSAPEPASDELRRAFEAGALKVWQALLTGRKVEIVIEPEPGRWIPYTGPFATMGPVCACETVEEVALDPRD